MSKHDLEARPIYHHHRDSIEAHLTMVFAAIAVSRGIEDAPAGQSGSSSELHAARNSYRHKTRFIPLARAPCVRCR
jgi:hypothetical protein